MPRSGRTLTRARERSTAVRHPTLEEAIDRFLADREAAGHSPKYLTHLKVTLADFARFIQQTRRTPTVATLTTETFQAFVTWLKETPLARTYRGTTRRTLAGVHGHMRDLRTWVRFLAEEEYITWRVKVPLPKIPRRFYPVLTREELATLYALPLLSGKGEANIRNRAIFALLLDTGICLAKCANLTPGAIKYGTHIEVIGKGDKERVVPFGPQVGELLDAWLEVRQRLDPGPADTLFLLTDHGIGQMIERLADRTGIAVYPHKLRHTACTLMLMRGMDLHSVSRVMGHVSLVTTQGYISQLPEDLRAKHAPASPFLAMQEEIDRRAPQPVRRRRKLTEDAA